MKARRLAYTFEALNDLAEIRAFYRAQASAAVAARMIARIRIAIRRAREAPGTGVARPEYRPNCRFAAAYPYIVYYDFDGEALVVLRVLHQARDRTQIMTAHGDL